MRTYDDINQEYEALVAKENVVETLDNGLLMQYCNPVLTKAHIPPFWMYDPNPESNPFMMQRLGVNGVYCSGAVFLNGKYTLIARVEGADRKSFFAIAQSEKGTEGFRFWNYPILFEDRYPEESDIYGMRLTKHEDGYIYGIFPVQSRTVSSENGPEITENGIIRSKDLINWERLPNLRTGKTENRLSVCLFPEFVDQKYAFYSGTKETFCEAEAEEKNGFSLCEDMTNPYLSDDFLSGHIGVEEYNGSGSVQIKTDQGWIHIFCETQKTASGLHTAVYAFATALEMPGKVIAKPGGVLLDLDCNACGKATAVDAIVENNDVYLYFTAGDGCIRVATIALDRLMDYVFHTPENRTRSIDSVKQRCLFIAGNLQYLHCLNCKKELNLE